MKERVRFVVATACGALGVVLAQTGNSSALAQTAVAPTPAPRAVLREIGRVRVSTPFCKQIVGAASGAVAPMLAFDARFTRLIDDLDGISFDRSPLHRAQAMRLLTKAYVDLWQLSARGRSEVTDLRKAAYSADDGGQIDALEAFADAVDGAKRRQRDMALTMGALLAKLDANNLAGPEGDQNGFGSLASLEADPALPTPDPDDPIAGQPVTRFVNDTLGNYLEEEERVVSGEREAGGHVRSAFYGCL